MDVFKAFLQPSIRVNRVKVRSVYEGMNNRRE